MSTPTTDTPAAGFARRTPQVEHYLALVAGLLVLGIALRLIPLVIGVALVAVAAWGLVKLARARWAVAVVAAAAVAVLYRGFVGAREAPMPDHSVRARLSAVLGREVGSHESQGVVLLELLSVIETLLADKSVSAKGDHDQHGSTAGDVRRDR